MELESLQIYWWLLISVLGAILVFLLFVQGGQTFLLGVNDSSEASRRMISSFGHKWELSFTTLVVFGGAFSPLSRYSIPRASAEPIGSGCSFSSVSCFRR